MGDTPLLERVKALAPLVEASADEMERRAALTDEVASAIRESGALHLMVPASMGGDELGIVDDIEVFEELARQDGSVGWSTMAASVSTTFAAIYTSDDVAEGLFGTDREAVLAGQLAPMGRAEVDGDGYVVSGSYRFGSGSDQTTHMLAGCLVFRDGEMVMRPNGMPDVVAAVIPNDHVEFKGNWDVIGPLRHRQRRLRGRAHPGGWWRGLLDLHRGARPWLRRAPPRRHRHHRRRPRR